MKYIIPILLLLSGCGFKTIDAGDVGVKTEFGKVSGDILDPGLNFYNPVTSTVHEMNCRTQTWSSKNETYTKDIQQSTIDYTINYNLDPKFAQQMFSEVGVSWGDKLLPQVINATIKNTIGQWDAVDLISNRTKVIDSIQTELSSTLASKGVIVSRFEITNVAFTKEFEDSVEKKVVAVQAAAEAANHTVQIREEANQRIIAAKADAEAMTIKSQALSQNSNLVAYEAVLRWDGSLPTYMTGNSVPFISIPNGKKE